MKILDRYILMSFLKNYLISLLVLIGLYIVLDMVFNFDELVEVKGQSAGGFAALWSIVVAIADFYFFNSFLIFTRLAGIIPIVAAAFTLFKFVRNNELTAMLAAGIRIQRIAMPILICGVILNLALLPIAQEVVIPSIVGKLTRKHDQVIQNNVRSFELQPMQDDQGGLFMAGRYTPPTSKTTAEIQGLDVAVRDADYNPLYHISADTAEFDARTQSWKLTGGRRVDGLGADQRRTAPKPIDTYKSNITPTEIALARSSEYVELLSTRQISSLLARKQAFGTANLLRAQNVRFTQWILNVILLWLAVPCVLQREPGKLKLSAIKLLLLVGLGLATVFISQQLAGSTAVGRQYAALWPAMMTWLPILIFGPLSIALLDRAKS